MKVKYFHHVYDSDGKRLCYANIKWDGEFPMKRGYFPPNHPAAPRGGFCDGGDGQCGNTAPLNAFRSRGYWASCFPEGDGITMECSQGQDAETAAKDIRECFGWDVEIARA